MSDGDGDGIVARNSHRCDVILSLCVYVRRCESGISDCQMMVQSTGHVPRLGGGDKECDRVS